MMNIINNSISKSVCSNLLGLEFHINGKNHLKNNLRIVNQIFKSRKFEVLSVYSCFCIEKVIENLKT